MIFTSSSCLRAAFLLAAVTAGPRLAAAGVETPSYRELWAAEGMVSSGQNGTDYSANPRSLAGLTLLATIPASSAARSGYLVQAQCSAGLTVVLDDAAGQTAATIIALAGAAADGGQGGSLSMAGMPHSGRIRIYSSSATCQMAARAW